MVLNPATPLETLSHYLHLLDKVTIMTVDPGYAGQPFIPEMVEKIARLQQIKQQRGLSFLIEVDGSCNRQTYRKLLEAGAQVLILGSSGLFRPDVPLAQAWDTLIQDLDEASHSPAHA
ncbi:D-allulose-6-phosphate 3-epimerase [Raoultella planticola]|nr:D-allulose-6-phosphate 3-epimerase [Raoultella planticola]